MRTSTYSRPVIVTANVLSAIFAPLFIPTYSTVICFSDTGMRVLPLSSRLAALGVIVLLTALVPLLSLYILKRKGRITDIDVSVRSQRLLPVIIMVVCYLATLGYVWASHAPAWFVLYFASGIVTAVILGIVTMAMRWKISMHGAGMGNVIALILALWIHGYAEYPMPWLLTAALLIAGLVGSSRVILNRHTLGQVFCGALVSGLVTYAMMSI